MTCFGHVCKRSTKVDQICKLIIVFIQMFPLMLQGKFKLSVLIIGLPIRYWNNFYETDAVFIVFAHDDDVIFLLCIVVAFDVVVVARIHHNMYVLLHIILTIKCRFFSYYIWILDFP